MTATLHSPKSHQSKLSKVYRDENVILRAGQKGLFDQYLGAKQVFFYTIRQDSF